MVPVVPDTVMSAAYEAYEGSSHQLLGVTTIEFFTNSRPSGSVSVITTFVAVDESLFISNIHVSVSVLLSYPAPLKSDPYFLR